ncbi:MAG: glycosyltransferase [Gemmatimonadota bacterium]|nr:glycosyltransferase [Gemmatimonadota bacterium]
MITVIYSFNKTGFEAEYWTREIAGASNADVRFVPFNHGKFIETGCYVRAQLLDNLFAARDPRLKAMYSELDALMKSEKADVLLVDTCPPYHPEYLRTLPIYKVLRIADGPLASYDRDLAYLHAYDHILYHSPAYSPEIDMKDKLAYCGAKRADFWPLALFDAAHDTSQTEETLFALERDIDVVFVGAMHIGKMPLLAQVKKAFGRRCVMRGLTSFKRNAYFNAKFGFPGWVRPIDFKEYVPLYQRAKIGFNVHNRGKYTVGGYRMFELPGNGVMQISDGGEYLSSFYEPGREIIGYEEADELIELIRHYLANDAERETIGRNGYRRVMRDHRIKHRLAQAAALIEPVIPRRGGA